MPETLLTCQKHTQRSKQSMQGTRAGYERHRRNGERACEPCLVANRDLQRIRRLCPAYNRGNARRVAAWRRKNPGMSRHYELLRSERAAHNHLIPASPPSPDTSKCQCCGTTDDLVIDHVISIAKGGAHHPLNQQTLCDMCNRSKYTGDRCIKHDTFLGAETQACVLFANLPRDIADTSA